MDVPAVPGDVGEKAFSMMAAAIDLGHKQRVKVITESALAMALKLKLEGKMSTPEFDALEKTVTSIEQSGVASIAAINQLGPAAAAAIPPEKIVALDQRLQAVATALQSAVAQHTVASSPNSTPSSSS